MKTLAYIILAQFVIIVNICNICLNGARRKKVALIYDTTDRIP